MHGGRLYYRLTEVSSLCVKYKTLYCSFCPWYYFSIQIVLVLSNFVDISSAFSFFQPYFW